MKFQTPPCSTSNTFRVRRDYKDMFILALHIRFTYCMGITCIKPEAPKEHFGGQKNKGYKVQPPMILQV